MSDTPLRWPEDRGGKPPVVEEEYRGPRVGRVLRKALRHSYDSLAVVVLGSVAWSGLALVVGITGLTLTWPTWWMAAALAVTAFTSAAAGAGLWFAAGRVAAGRSAGVADLWEGLRSRYLPTLGVTAFLLGGLALAAGNIAFYTRVGGIGLVLVSVTGYVALFLLAVGLYAPALAVQPGVGTRRALYRAALLVLDNLLYTGGLLAVMLAVWGVALLPLALGMKLLAGLSTMWLLFAGAGFTAVVSNEALADVMRKYKE